jgi:chromosome segregation ATPase
VCALFLQLTPVEGITVEWLQDHMRKHSVDAQRESNVLSLRPSSQDEQFGLRAVELAERAIQHIRDTEQQAADRHARAEALARNAIEELQKAEHRVRAAEHARRAIEARFDQAHATLRDMEIQLERAAADAAAAQTKISAAQEETRNAEKRAAEAENALKRIETMLDALLAERRLSTRQIAA